MAPHVTVAPGRAWCTWSSRPAEMVFLPLGVALTPVAYAASTGKASLFAPGEGVRYGPHTLDASSVGLELTHAGTRLAWNYRKPDPFAFLGSWRALALGEWGLRFWINLCLSAADGSAVRYDAAREAATVAVGHRFTALVAESAPVQVTGHATVAALATEYEQRGYFYLGSQQSQAPVLALRFNLEMTRNGRFAVAVADREDLAVERARELLADKALTVASCGMPATPPDLPSQSGRFAGALDAIRDVMAWNTVWDEFNARPYTSSSRNWNASKFGGFGVWLNDQQYAAMLAGLVDPEVGRENLFATLASAAPDGNLACLLTANDAWVDRSQLPLGAFLVWLMYMRSRSRPLLRQAYPTLTRNHAWFWRHRDPHRRGLASYGTSDVGNGLYKGTSFGARNESSMDNAPIHDEAPYDTAARTLASMDVGLNSLLALDAEMLSLMAAELGDDAAAEAHATRAAALKEKIGAELWDASRGIFANRLWSGQFVRSLGPTSFYPLICGAATQDQTAHLVAHLADRETFGGRLVIPSVARNDPAFADNTYWRGRIWPPLNYLVWQGLRRCGRRAEASRLAAASFALFRDAWETRRICAENYNAETGEPLDQPDTDAFYSWGALLPLMAVGEVMDVNPWGGWEIVNDGDAVRLGPVESPVGSVILTVADGVLRLAKGATVFLETNVVGAMTRLRCDDRNLALTLPEEVGAGAYLRLPGVPCGGVLLARIGDRNAPWAGHGAGIALTDLAPGATIRVVWRGEGNRA